MPEFPGGHEAMMTYIAKQLKYPEEAVENNIQGRVFIAFVVERDVSISEVKVLRGIGAGCDKEAVRVVMGMPKWLPGKQKGKMVRVRTTAIPVQPLVRHFSRAASVDGIIYSIYDQKISFNTTKTRAVTNPRRNNTTSAIPPTKLKASMSGKASPTKAAEGDKPVFDYIASLPQPQRGIAERIDASCHYPEVCQPAPPPFLLPAALTAAGASPSVPSWAM